MYKNEICDTKEKISENDLLALENKFNFTMPKTIKKHMLFYNGGYPKKSVFIDKNKNEYTVTGFIPIIDKKGKRDMFETLRLLRDDKILPNWLIPFADEYGGNLFCYSIRDKDNGSIYYYDHEFEYGDNPENHVEYLEESLSEFINSLVEDEDE